MTVFDLLLFSTHVALALHSLECIWTIKLLNKKCLDDKLKGKGDPNPARVALKYHNVHGAGAELKDKEVTASFPGTA